jgi:hypothetical protein
MRDGFLVRREGFLMATAAENGLRYLDDVKRIDALKLEPGDTLVVHHADGLTKNEVENIGRSVQQFVNCRVIMSRERYQLRFEILRRGE